MGVGRGGWSVLRDATLRVAPQDEGKLAVTSGRGTTF
jgi:hypothetical protein